MGETRSKKDRVGLRTAGLWPAFFEFGLCANGKTEHQQELTIMLHNQFLLTSH
jgi:hypothetical protein